MKIKKVFNNRKQIHEYKTRFQLNGEEFYPVAESRKALSEIVDEIRARQHRIKRGLNVAPASPALQQLFEIHHTKINKKQQRQLFSRVSELFLSLLPPGIKIDDLKKSHFQKYIDLRLAETGKQTGRKILPQTIDKELYSISGALSAAPLYFAELDEYRKPDIPKATAAGAKRRRTRLVDKENELDRLLAELRQRRSGKQTELHEAARRRLADDLEFRFETGLRRIESARLKKKQYDSQDKSLREVRRWKTGTVTKYFPLSRRAAAIVESRLAGSSEYIFTTGGEAVESDYRTLKKLCAALGINYGRYSESGFVPHDFRHNFATDIIRVTDIETAKSLTGHTGAEIFTYLHTTNERQREAMDKREKKDPLSELRIIFESVKSGKTDFETFISEIRKIGLF